MRWLDYLVAENRSSYLDMAREQHRDYNNRAPRNREEYPPPPNTPDDVDDFYTRQEYTHSRLGYFKYDINTYFP
eukprot:12921420-Prorocentrum_lima.AAC.1